MKYFLVFTGTLYYPGGGFSDLSMVTSSQTEAVRYAKEHESGRNDWVEIIQITVTSEYGLHYQKLYRTNFEEPDEEEWPDE